MTQALRIAFVHPIAPQVRVEVASRWHLAFVVFFLLAVGTATLVSHAVSHSQPLQFQTGQRLPAYLRLALVEWLVFGYVLFGIRRRGNTAKMIIDACPAGLGRWFSSVAFGIGATILWMVLGAVIMAALRPTPDELRSIQSFLPRGLTEKFAFAILTLTAGFCEEFIYRGYLQRQFQTWTGSLTLAIILQAGLFALLHVTLPWKFIVSVTVMAIFLGALVGWKETLIPAMLVHTIVNLLGGLLSSTAPTA